MNSGDDIAAAGQAQETSSADDWAALQLRIARRADELAKGAGQARHGSGRRFWLMAEQEIIGPASRIALGDLLAVCARFSGARRAHAGAGQGLSGAKSTVQVPWPGERMGLIA